ncbi:MAG: DMT family transporter [Chitinophagales bacterium]|nr:DMT family transporter [Chitinophagales bacterium]MDW8419140.1 DMT family transporter [Chitinophagales bacterium]
MKNIRPHLYLFIVNLFYGAGFTVSKAVMPEYIGPFAFILIRVTVTAVLFTMLQKIWLRETVHHRHVPLLIACSLFGVVLNQELFFLGLSMTTPINASLIMIMTPILVFVISFLMGYEKSVWFKWVGLLAGLAGALMIMGGSRLQVSDDTLAGDLCIFLNATSYAVYLVIVRPLMQTYHPLTVIRWVFLLGCVPVTLFGWKELISVNWHMFTPAVWAAVVFVVICITFLAYLLNIMALREVNASVVGAYIYLQPALATIIAVAAGKDNLTLHKLLAGMLIFAGVFLVSFSHKIKKQQMTTDV